MANSEEQTTTLVTDQPITACNAIADPLGTESCTAEPIAGYQVLLDNLPYIIMCLLGSVIFWLAGREMWRWLLGGLYLGYGAAGAIWIILFVCPYCHFYDTGLCPCGYGRIAARLRSKNNPDLFARRFRRHIPVIVPLWILPVAGGVVSLFGQFSWLLLGLLGAFLVNSYVILPLVSRRYGCASCPQKKNCPWMSRCDSL